MTFQVQTRMVRVPLLCDSIRYESGAAYRLDQYPGNLFLVGKEGTDTYRVLFSLPCSSIIVDAWPKLYVNVPDYLELVCQSYSYFGVVAPNGVTESQVTTAVASLNP